VSGADPTPTSAIFTDAVTLKPVDPEVFDAAFTATMSPP
jgi:acyl-CoA thioesterase-2